MVADVNKALDRICDAEAAHYALGYLAARVEMLGKVTAQDFADAADGAEQMRRDEAARRANNHQEDQTP